jgi:hypothetical protein
MSALRCTYSPKRMLLANAQRTPSLPADGAAALHHIQLLRAQGASWHVGPTRPFRICVGAHSQALLLGCSWIRRNARACTSSGERARARKSGAGHSSAQAIGCGATTRAPVLAGAVLRLQRVVSGEATRKAALYTPQPSGPGSGGTSGGLEVVELPALRNRMRRAGGDRIVLDRVEAGTPSLVASACCKLTGHGLRFVLSRVSKARPGAPSIYRQVSINEP